MRSACILRNSARRANRSSALQFQAAIRNWSLSERTNPCCQHLPVFTTVIKLANHPLNVRANRVMLTQFLADMIDRASSDQAHSVMDCLRVIINGATSSPADMEEPTSTMRFQMKSTTAGELKASALRSSALVLAHFSDLTREEDIAAFRLRFLTLTQRPDNSPATPSRIYRNDRKI